MIAPCCWLKRRQLKRSKASPVESTIVEDWQTIEPAAADPWLRSGLDRVETTAAG